MVAENTLEILQFRSVLNVEKCFKERKLLNMISGADPRFLEGGSNPTRGVSFLTFYLIFHRFCHESEIILSESGVRANPLSLI